jgi:hypothetical protein
VADIDRRLKQNERETANLVATLAAAGPVPAIVEQLKTLERARAALAAARDAVEAVSATAPWPSDAQIIERVFARIRSKTDATEIRELLKALLRDSKIECTPRRGNYLLRWTVKGLDLIAKHPDQPKADQGVYRVVAGAGFEPTTFGL